MCQDEKYIQILIRKHEGKRLPWETGIAER
jgi:hypothetical protein